MREREGEGGVSERDRDNDYLILFKFPFTFFQFQVSRWGDKRERERLEVSDCHLSSQTRGQSYITFFFITHERAEQARVFILAGLSSLV